MGISEITFNTRLLTSPGDLICTEQGPGPTTKLLLPEKSSIVSLEQNLSTIEYKYR